MAHIGRLGARHSVVFCAEMMLADVRNLVRGHRLHGHYRRRSISVVIAVALADDSADHGDAAVSLADGYFLLATAYADGVRRCARAVLRRHFGAGRLAR